MVDKTPMHSAIYRGRIRHTRFSPKFHNFEYSVFMAYIDLDELTPVFSTSICWSFRSPALAWLRRKDFIGPHQLSIKEAVARRIFEETGNAFQGSVRVLANLRYFGFLINPLVVYYCFNQQDELEYMVAEVTNTPWRERQSYVLPCHPNRAVQRIEFDKKLHVSPFNPMDMEYRWISNKPDKRLSIYLANWQDENKIFEANLRLEREDIKAHHLTKLILNYPFMTIKVALGIYWQALRLFLKGVPLFNHPKTKAKLVGRQHAIGKYQ